MSVHAFVIAPPAIVRSPARTALAAAIRARDAAAEGLTAATATVGRARAAAGDVEQRLAAIGDVDAEILAHHSAAYRAWAESGGEKPIDTATPLHLTAAQRARDALRTESAAAAAAVRGLEAERAAAVEALNKADAAVHDAAKSVLVEEAGVLLEQYAEARRRALQLHDDIAALAMLSVQRGRQTWEESRLALPLTAHAAVTTPMDHRPLLPAAHSYAGRQLPKWRVLFDALLTDADAER